MLISFLLIIGIYAIAEYFIIEEENVPESDVAAFVNGEKIFVDDIKRVLSEYDETDGITYEKILQNSIDELVVVQHGIKQGYDATDEEIKQRELYLKNNMPEVYFEIEEIGIEKYRENLRNLIIFEKVKKDYLEKFSKETKVTDDEAKQWYVDNISKDMKNFEKNRALIISSLQDEKKNERIDDFIKTLRKDSEIIINEKR